MDSRAPHPTRRSATLIALASLAPFASDAAFAETIYRSTAADGTVVFSDRPAPDATVIEPGPISVVSPDADASNGRSDTDGSARTAAATAPANEPSGSAPDGRPLDRGGDVTVGTRTDPIAPNVALGTTPTPGADGTDSGVAVPSASPVLAGAAPASPTAAVASAAAADAVERVVIASPPPDATLLDAPGPLIVEIGTSPGPLSSSGLGAEVLLDGEVVASGTSAMLAVPAPERGEHRLQVRLVDASGRTVLTSEPQALHVRRDTVDVPLGTDR